MRNYFVLVGTIILTGCANLNVSKEIPSNLTATFYKAPNNGMASIYYACGKSKVDSWLLKTVERDLEFCKLQINNTTYSTVKTKSVGRVDLEPGIYEFKNQEEMLARSISTKIEIREKDVIFLTSEFSQSVGVTGSSYVYTINWSKENPIELIKNLKPVELKKLD